MLLFRYQNAWGDGPYRDYVRNYFPRLKEMEGAHTGDPERPVPWRDQGIGFLFDPHKHRCAFLSEYDAHTWFDGWEEELVAAGFNLVTIEVPDEHVIIGEYQVIYTRDYAHVAS